MFIASADFVVIFHGSQHKHCVVEIYVLSVEFVFVEFMNSTCYARIGFVEVLKH